MLRLAKEDEEIGLGIYKM